MVTSENDKTTRDSTKNTKAEPKPTRKEIARQFHRRVAEAGGSKMKKRQKETMKEGRDERKQKTLGARQGRRRY